MAMQYDMQTPLRTPMPVFCPFCGAGVSMTAPTCAVCGVANPAAKINATLDLGTSPEDFLPEEVLRTLGSAPSDRLPPPQTARSCATCDAKLDLGAKFCWSCGGAVGLKLPFRPEPLREKVVQMPRPAPAPIPEPEPAPEPEPEPRETRPGRHIALADVEDEIAEDLPPPPKHTDPMEYLDAQLGLKACGHDPLPPPKTARRPGRHLALADEASDVAPKRDAVAPAPVRRPVSPDPLAPDLSATPAWAVPVATGFALFALGLAVLVHLFAPNAIPGYSVAELDLKVQMRAVEWLLAGILVALVGLLVKR
jgi:hypothetical protein